MASDTYLEVDGLTGPAVTAVGGYTGLFEIGDYSFNMSQTLNIGSQAGGAGAGKVVFGSLTITKAVDATSPEDFQSPLFRPGLTSMQLMLSKSGGGDGSVRGYF